MAKLTAEMLKKLVQEELKKLKTPADVAKDTEEVDADEYADTLEKHVDMLKALKIEEGRLSARLKKIQEQKELLIKKISK